MQETLYQTADAEFSLSGSGCRRHSFKQRMQNSLYQTAEALSESDAEDHSDQKTLYQMRLHLIECLLHPLSDRETSASAV